MMSKLCVIYTVWRDNMKQDGVFGDQIFLHSTANVLSSNIYIFSAIKDSLTDRLNGYTKIEPIVPAMNEDIYLFLFNESDFKTPHYESIFRKEGFKMPPPIEMALPQDGFDVIADTVVTEDIAQGGRGRGGRGRG